MELRTLAANGGPSRQAFGLPLIPDPMAPGPRPGSQESADVQTCIANISPRERLKRLVGGVIPFMIALALLAALLATGSDRLWRLFLFFPFAAAAIGYFQWRDKT